VNALRGKEHSLRRNLNCLRCNVNGLRRKEHSL
jgi:hypothetical protein